MMASPWRPGAWIWLVAGTEDGPGAAQVLLELAMAVRVQVVSPRACRAYGQLKTNSLFQCQAMALGPGAIQRLLSGPAPPGLVVDATHPFALKITQVLHGACRLSTIPYLRLQRPQLQPGPATVVDNLEALQSLGQRSLLAAIGSRSLGHLLRYHPPRLTAARILPTAAALQQALAVGLLPERIAPLQPISTNQRETDYHLDPTTSLEAALCRHWAIEVVLARQSGGTPEHHWHRVCKSLGVSLWLLGRPEEPTPMATCTRDTLFQRAQECLYEQQP